MDKKNRLLIIAGSGASIEFGMPSVRIVGDHLRALAQEICPLADDPNSNLYSFIERAIISFQAGGATPDPESWANFETVLYEMNHLGSLLFDRERDRPQNAANALIDLRDLPDLHSTAHFSKIPKSHQLMLTAASLVDRVVEVFKTHCASIGLDKPANIQALSRFIEDLRQDYDIGEVSLNYDNVFSLACPQLATGFHPESGAFDPLAVHQRTDWDFLYHLHGSVHFSMPSDGPVHEGLHRIYWTDEIAAINTARSAGRDALDSEQGIQYPTSTIIAGLGKTDQLLREPFRTFYAALNRRALEADSLLVLGYGFGDVHVNAAFSDVQARRRPTVVVDYAERMTNPLQFRSDAWAHALQSTLPTNQMGSENGPAAPVIGDLRDNKQFEVSQDADYPLAVWYDGLMSATEQVEKVKRHLR